MCPNREERNINKKNQVVVETECLLHVSWSKGLYNTGTLAESRPENPVCVLEHAILQRDNNELRSLESRLDQTADVLRVRQIQSSVNLIKNVHWGGFELQKRHDQRQSNKRALATTQFR